ncbi:glycosyltransferase family 2 protein [Psychroserpens sp. Hel_I_66]|uniref:glycosyltransferase family 2 protein n=1 Tax=Psychroserpens sp. Hel_I_66 TaxID=1250004 RepID=UPI000646FBF0|nr:glycosyltransferase family 2 protein [Psychroserpens sp. Hel_I_66]
MDFKFTILIPVYNEEANLIPVEKALTNYLKNASILTKVLFINDGSKDSSQTIIEDICGRNPNFDCILLSENYGLSAALKAGFDHITTPLVGYMDADLQTTPEDFELLLAHIDDHAMVTGIRSNRKDRLIKNVSSKIANYIRRLFTKDGIQDTGCPLKVMHTNYAKAIPMFKGLHRFLPAMILLQEGTVKQISVRHFPRVAGKSKFGLRKRLVTPFIDCFAYLWIKKRTINYKIKKSSL